VPARVGKFVCVFLVMVTVREGVSSAKEEALVLESGDRKARLIELFTSQGCSSCPPAEKWLNAFSEKKGLWTEYVPVAFHVDYWNWLGWKDVFSRRENSERQRRHQKENHLSSAYTPCFVIDGREWKGWFSLNRKLPRVEEPGYPLSAKILGTQVEGMVFRGRRAPGAAHRVTWFRYKVTGHSGREC